VRQRKAGMETLLGRFGEWPCVYYKRYENGATTELTVDGIAQGRHQMES
jgi:hypothetical protein